MDGPPKRLSEQVVHGGQEVERFFLVPSQPLFDVP